MRALITGCSGQDGRYLSQLLLSKGYEVFGLVRRNSRPTAVEEGVAVLYGDMTDQGSINSAVIRSQPDEVYNLAAQSFVGVSWDIPISTIDVTGLGAVRVLEAVRHYKPGAKVYQASSSEMFGDQVGMLNEYAPFQPRSPYGAAKVLAHNMAVNYRESYDMFISCGILFNHESPLRGEEFVTQKIVRAAQQGRVAKLGNISARRDWGHAEDYVEAMWLMLQQDTPDDYVVATGESHSVKDILTLTGCDYEEDKSQLRPADINELVGDASKAKTILGWKPTFSFEEMITEMMAVKQIH